MAKKAEQYELFDLRTDLEIFEELAADFRKVRNAIASWYGALDGIRERPDSMRFTKVIAQAQDLLELELAEGPGAGDNAPNEAAA